MTKCYLDNSTLSSVSTCATQALLRYHHHRTSLEESARLVCGSAVHQAIAAYFKGASAAETLLVFEGAYRAWSDAHTPEVRLSYENVARILEEWLVRHPKDGLAFTVSPELVEVNFAVPFDNGFVLCGTMDTLVEDKRDGSLWVMDTKTTGRIDGKWLSKWTFASQLSGYVWAAQQHLAMMEDDRVVVGALINGIELARIPSDPSKKCRDHATAYAECGLQHIKMELKPVVRTPQQLTLWYETAVQQAYRWRFLQGQYGTVEQLIDAPMEGLFNGACAWCEFASFCADGKPVERVAAYTVEDTWRPFRPHRTP